jgi:hypothetical protein
MVAAVEKIRRRCLLENTASGSSRPHRLSLTAAMSPTDQLSALSCLMETTLVLSGCFVPNALWECGLALRTPDRKRAVSRATGRRPSAMMAAVFVSRGQWQRLDPRLTSRA